MGFDIDEDRRQLIHEFKQKLEEAFDRYYENLLAGLDRAFEGLKEKNPMEDVTVKEEKELDEEPEMTKMSEEKEDEAAATNGHSEMEDFTASKLTTYRSMSNPLEMSEETIMEEEVKISGHEVFDEMHNTNWMEEIGVDFGPGNVLIQQLSLEGSTKVEYLGVDYQQYQDVTTDEDEIKTFWLFYPGIKLCVDVESDSEAEKTGQEDDAKLIAAAIGDVEAHKAQNQVIDGGDVARPPVQLAHGGDVAEGSKDGHLNVVVGQNLFLENSLPTKFIYIKEIIMGQEEDFKLDKSYQAGNYSMQGNNQALCNRLHRNEVKNSDMDITNCTAMISRFSLNGMNGAALEILSWLINKNMRLIVITFVSALPACAGLNALMTTTRRKYVLSSVVCLVGDLMTFMADTFVLMVTERFTYGIGIKLAMHAAPMYIAETDPGRIQGRLISFKEFLMFHGMLVKYIASSGVCAPSKFCIKVELKIQYIDPWGQGTFQRGAIVM